MVRESPAEDQPPVPDSRSDLVSFIEAARGRGASDEFISKLLRSYGWPHREIERAFFLVYERLTSQSIPTPKGLTGESARDAFLYLLSFSMLAIWTQSLGQLGFIFVDTYLPDPLERYYRDPTFEIAFCLARLIVAFPVYLLIMRQLLKDLRVYREKYQSGVRKWLTYLTLLVVSLIAIGTLIAFLTSFLRGDLTLRFVLKVLVTLVIDGGVLWYYFVWLRRRPVGV
ncbi:MAG: DUF5671 domain-containing protein [Leptolyngbyaceae cyanobacterium MO_188.B28]|nr:DUF5671 domain-containing protein [Leptolyngbyaceae cyanobacterium MO_188.B28]